MPKRRKRAIELNLDPTERQMVLYVDADVKRRIHKLWVMSQSGFLRVPIGKLNDLMQYILVLGVERLYTDQVEPIEDMTIRQFIDSVQTPEEVDDGSKD